MLPTFDFSFRADFRADSTVSLPRLPCSLLSVLAVASLFSPFLFIFIFIFISFFPFHLNLAATSLSPSPPPASPSHRRYPVGATSTPQLPHQPRGHYNRHHVTLCGHANHLLHPPSHASWAHTSHPAALALTMPSAPKKASISHFPFFPPSSLTVQDTSPRAHAGCPFAVAIAIVTTATTSRPLQPAPPHQPHHPTTGVTRLCHTDRGCKRCTGPHHFHDTPICSPSPFV